MSEEIKSAAVAEVKKVTSPNGVFITLYDSKTEVYSKPTLAGNNADALRQFGILVNDRNGSLVSMHPEDFTLFRIGSLEGFTLIPEERQALANGVDVKLPEAN